jgi:DedD protein
MTGPEDTEITLGTGKMLVLFFGLVLLCAVFFGMGFKLGKNSVATAPAGDLMPATTATTGGARPSAVKSAPNASPSPDLSFYKTVEQKGADTQLAPKDAAPTPPGASTPPDSKPSDPMVAPPLNGYYVQVAAVSKQEDAESLVDALKKKQYPAFATNTPPDKLFHVQVGPFADIKDAEATRAKLVGDGYNPILKK